MKATYRTTLPFALLLNLLLPGAGHFLWRETLFGLFVFLTMLLAAALFVVQYLISLPALAIWFLLGLPGLFYLFTFVDLTRTVRTRRAKVTPTKYAALVCLIIGIIYQVASPSAAVNFTIRNFPDIFKISDSHLSPLYRQGDIAVANRLAYTAEIPFLKRPVLHKLPERFDLVRFSDDNGRLKTGFVIGKPVETIYLVDGVLTADDLPIVVTLPTGFALTGEWPLTVVEDYSILVGTFNLGTLDDLHQVPLDQVVGRVGSYHQ
ncbi:MAG: hypothetical protein IPH75_15915 [bacterium]|nr:hypothetical protein [bacterium]